MNDVDPVDVALAYDRACHASSIIVDVSERDLARVELAAERAAAARAELHASIVEAHEHGETLRSIAEAAGLSFQRVHQIVQERKA